MAFHGTPLETLSEEHAEEAVTGAMLVASGIDDLRTIRIRIEQYFAALAKAAKKKR